MKPRLALIYRNSLLALLALSSVLAVTLAWAAARSSNDSWPSWRGDAEGSGRVVGEPQLPLEWGPEKNVKWRVPLREPGNSTPAVWGDKVFLTQPNSSDQSRNLICYSRADGSRLWKRGVVYAAEERTHRTNHYCSASPAVDEERVVVSFGSAGVLCFDHDGKELWRRDFGAIDHVWGNSTSPVIHGDLVIHYHGPARNAVLYGLDKRSGETVWEWKEPRWAPESRTDGFSENPAEGVIGSFSTPIIVDTGERVELVMSFPMEMKAFDPETGEELWTCSGLNPLVYTSPVHDGGIVVAMGGYYGNSIGVRVGGEGDVTETHRLWWHERHNGGIGSGVALDGKLYYQNTGGVVFCDDMATGETLWRDRLPGAGKSWGSFVLVGDLVYTLSQAGDSVIFRASPEGFDLVSQADLGEETNSSIAVAGAELFIRTHEALWCIAE